jgi:hypothetical protein
MPPLSYPDLGWSGGKGRFARTLQVVVIAGSVGAVGGGAGALAGFGIAGVSSSQHFSIRISKPRTSVQLGAAAASHSPSAEPALRANVAPAAAPAATVALAKSVTPLPTAPAGRQAHSGQARPSAVQDFYDRVQPSPSGGAATHETLDPSIPLPLPAPTRAERGGKRAERARLADAAPAGSVSPSPSAPTRAPMSILPGRQPAFSRDRAAGRGGGSAYADRRRGRPRIFARDRWRDERAGNRDGGLFDSFGSFGSFDLFGGSWRD